MKKINLNKKSKKLYKTFARKVGGAKIEHYLLDTRNLKN